MRQNVGSLIVLKGNCKPWLFADRVVGEISVVRIKIHLVPLLCLFIEIQVELEVKRGLAPVSSVNDVEEDFHRFVLSTVKLTPLDFGSVLTVDEVVVLNDIYGGLCVDVGGYFLSVGSKPRVGN